MNNKAKGTCLFILLVYPTLLVVALSGFVTYLEARGLKVLRISIITTHHECDMATQQLE